MMEETADKLKVFQVLLVRLVVKNNELLVVERAIFFEFSL